MSDNTLPIHPTTGLRALGYTSRGPVWPALGGSGEGDGATGDSGNDGGSGTDADGGSNGSDAEQQKAAETVDWKSMAREWEKRAKANSSAAEKLQKIEDAQKSETQKAADAKAAAEAEIAKVPIRVAEALREHLIGIHKIDKEDAELLLTADNPELLLKQVARLVGGSDKSKKNQSSREGRTTQRPGADAERETVRQLFNS